MKVSNPEMRIFAQGQGQFLRTAQLDGCQAARKGEGHGRPESIQGIARKRTFVRRTSDSAE